ncbi:SEL1-like repeat protein [Estrella lausannensis]|uniref:Uncharacterized protein n=1 Tax=Estrella lausannensis TaxID=483423 RepID=A0A0H5DQ26_9BACT|nr:SEL1-like repeat protein [Estrella lausannensis]CRX38582.1 hypothetical protein ELAC_1241 [Estrella lausannensis]
MNLFNSPHFPQFGPPNQEQVTPLQQARAAPGPQLLSLFQQGVPPQHLMPNSAPINPLGKIPFQIPFPVIPLPPIQAVSPAFFGGQTLPVTVASQSMEEEESKGVKRKQEDALNEDEVAAGATKKIRSEDSPLEAPVSRLRHFRSDETLLFPGEKEDLSAKLRRQRELEEQFGTVVDNIWKSAFDGAITEDQRREFIDTLEDLLQRGYARSAYTLAYLSLNDPAVSRLSQEYKLNCYRRGAELGSTDCCFALGMILYKNYPGGEKNAEVASYWRVAAALGHPNARFNYACLLLQGNGVEADPAVALKLLKENAEILNQPDAEYKLATELRSGEHIAEDLPRACDLLRRAASKGHTLAESTLAWALFYGEGTAVDKPEACALYKRCADRGDRKAQYNYALMKFTGDGVTADVEEAIRYLHLSADQNFPSAQHALANRYAAGDGLPKDKKKAFDLYKKAADDSKHVKSMLRVGKMYERGDGIEHNILKARQYYFLASKEGGAHGK